MICWHCSPSVCLHQIHGTKSSLDFRTSSRENSYQLEEKPKILEPGSDRGILDECCNRHTSDLFNRPEITNHKKIKHKTLRIKFKSEYDLLYIKLEISERTYFSLYKSVLNIVHSRSASCKSAPDCSSWGPKCSNKCCTCSSPKSENTCHGYLVPVYKMN